MKIFKVINNNIVITLDQNNQEIILMDRELGFKQRPGNNIDENLIEKRFLLVHQIMRNLQSLNYYPIFL